MSIIIKGNISLTISKLDSAEDGLMNPNFSKCTTPLKKTIGKRRIESRSSFEQPLDIQIKGAE